MWTCKQVSKTLENEDYETLSPWRKLALKLHVSLCMVCGKYNRQVMIMQDHIRTFKSREDEIQETLPGLAEERKAQIREQLKNS